MAKEKKSRIQFDMTISALSLSAEDLSALRFADFYYISELQSVSIDSLQFSDARKDRIKKALRQHLNKEESVPAEIESEYTSDEEEEDYFGDFEDSDDDSLDDLFLDDEDFEISLQDDFEDYEDDVGINKHFNTASVLKRTGEVSSPQIRTARTNPTESVLKSLSIDSHPGRSVSESANTTRPASVKKFGSGIPYGIFGNVTDPSIPIFPDFKVVDNQIIHTPSGVGLKDARIEGFLFTKKTYNCLKSVGIDTVQELIPFTVEAFLRIKDLEEKSVAEIYDKIKKYLDHQLKRNGIANNESGSEPTKKEQQTIDCTMANSQPGKSVPARTNTTKPTSVKKIGSGITYGIFENVTDPHVPIFPDFKVVDNQISHSPSEHVVKDVGIEDLHFSTRTYNCLKRVGIDTVQGIIPFTIGDILGIKNLGKQSAAEIHDKIKEYLDYQLEHQGEVNNESGSEPKNEEKLMLDGSITIVPFGDNRLRLGSEYTVADGIIINHSCLTGVHDAPISELDLSKRAYNGLFRYTIYKVSQLIGMPFDDLLTMKNLGQKSANEIREKLDRYLIWNSLPINGSNAGDSNGNADNDGMHSLVVEYTRDSVLSLFKNKEIEALTKESIVKSLPNSGVEIDVLIEELLEQGIIESADDGYQLVLPSFDEWIRSNPDCLKSSEIETLILRSTGFSLEEIGYHLHCTRERIRQIEASAFRKMKKVYCSEDRYRYLFQTYRITKNDWKEIFSSKGSDYYYLQGKYKKGDAEIGKAPDDLLLSSVERRLIQNKLHKGLIRIGDRYIPRTRHDIEDYVLEEFGRDELTIEQFLDIYNKFVKEHICDDGLLIDAEGDRYREGRLASSNMILWKQNRRLRYYDIMGRDFSELLETINLSQFHNVELSTLKFVRQFPELMEQYDIRDEYELHNILRKIHAEKENPELAITRMPGLSFGTFDRDAAVKEVLFENAPVSIEKLAIILSDEYGIREETIRANWLQCIAEYYHQGVYSVDYIPMPEQHLQVLKAALQKDFYTIEEIKKTYQEMVKGADSTLVSSFNLKRMGFVVNSTYVVQHYPSAEDYFTHLLTDEDIVDANDINQRFSMLRAYSSTLTLLKDNRTIIEFEPYQYINIRRLEKLGITKERLDRYCDEVAAWLTDERFFSIKSIHNDGFVSTLDELGFSDMFYNSLLREDNRFTYQRIGNQVVFNTKKERFARRDFVAWLVQEEESIDIDDFVTLLSERFGIIQDKHQVREQIKGSDVYFDSIMNKLYANYDLYYDEI